MIHNIVKNIVDVMNVNGKTFTFGHTQQSVQNINADSVELPVVFLNMPVKYTPNVTASGFIEYKFQCELWFLYKSNLDDNGHFNTSPETISEQQQIEIFEQALAAQRQFINLLPKSTDVKSHQAKQAIQVQHIFDADLSGVYCTIEIEPLDYSGVCADSLFPTPNCPTSSYLIEDTDGTILYNGTLQAGEQLTAIISDSVVSNSNDSFLVNVLSQQNLNLDDVTFNVTNSEDTELSTATIPAQENKTIQLPDINFTDSDGITTQEPSGIDLVCTPQTPCDPQLYQAAKVMQTGQVTSHTPNDDITRGRDVDFFTLDYVNEWGHSFRFCGVTGGYTDGTIYFDVNGASTTKALAFPDSVLLDFSSRNVNEILTYYYGDVTTVRNYVIACAFHEFSTFAGLTGWYLWNMKEMENLLNVDAYDKFNQWIGYPPFDFGSGQRYILTSTRTNSGTVIRTDLISTTYIGGSGVTSSLYNMFSRYTTLTELGL
jgi:hypothetical protein